MNKTECLEDRLFMGEEQKSPNAQNGVNRGQTVPGRRAKVLYETIPRFKFKIEDCLIAGWAVACLSKNTQAKG